MIFALEQIFTKDRMFCLRNPYSALSPASGVWNRKEKLGIFSVADPESVIRYFWPMDPGWEKIRIRDEHIPDHISESSDQRVG